MERTITALFTVVKIAYNPKVVNENWFFVVHKRSGSGQNQNVMLIKIKSGRRQPRLFPQASSLPVLPNHFFDPLYHSAFWLPVQVTLCLATVEQQICRDVLDIGVQAEPDPEHLGQDHPRPVIRGIDFDDVCNIARTGILNH
jgi:hypothetical protein